MNKKKILVGTVFFLIIMEIFFTAFLVISSGQNSVLCFLGSSCKEIQSSPYGQIFGIKLSQMGLVSFIILLGLFFLASKNSRYKFWFLLAGLLGTLFALYFIFVQIFILGKLCSECMIIDISAIIIFILSLFMFRFALRN